MMSLLAIVATSFAQAAQVQEAQAPPQWLGVHTYAPQGRVVGTYECDAGPVVIEIAAPGLRGRPRVEVWRVDGRSAPEALLNRWNGWLGELATYESFLVTCRGPWVEASIAGAKFGDGEPYAISVYWREDDLWRAPQSADEWRRASREGWSPPE